MIIFRKMKLPKSLIGVDQEGMDELSLHEYRIYGMCQHCQDEFLKEDDYDFEGLESLNPAHD